MTPTSLQGGTPAAGSRAAPVRVGIGGWNFPPWRGTFYPPGLKHAGELAYAASRLGAIEINATFYRQQSPASFAAWRDAAPPGFVFAVKAHRATTQSRDIAAAGPAIARFLGSGLAELGPKLGPVLWQLAPTKKFDADAMAAFLSLLPETVDGLKLRHAVEARHASFLDPAWPALAARHNVAVVIVDSDKQALRCDVTADFVYARLQRNQADAPEGYAGDALDGWAARLGAWSRGGDGVDGLPCFAFFISGDKVRAPDAAVAMMGRLGGE